MQESAPSFCWTSSYDPLASFEISNAGRSAPRSEGSNDWQRSDVVELLTEKPCFRRALNTTVLESGFAEPPRHEPETAFRTTLVGLPHDVKSMSEIAARRATDHSVGVVFRAHMQSDNDYHAADRSSGRREPCAGSIPAASTELSSVDAEALTSSRRRALAGHRVLHHSLAPLRFSAGGAPLARNWLACRGNPDSLLLVSGAAGPRRRQWYGRLALAGEPQKGETS